MDTGHPTTERQNDSKSCISLAVVQDNELD